MEILHRIAQWYLRRSAPVAWALAMFVLFAGLVLLAPLGSHAPPAVAKDLSIAWSEQPWTFASHVLLIPCAQALIFQVAILDGLARVGGPRWFWLVVSILAYSLGLHYAKGWFAMLLSAWLGLVYGAAYLAQRRRSLPRAAAMAAALQLGFTVPGVAVIILAHRLV